MKRSELNGLLDSHIGEYDSLKYDLSELQRELGIMSSSDYHDGDLELKAYWLENHICTDTEVGKRVYVLQGEVVATSVKQYRKADEYFTWVDKEAFDKVRAYVMSLDEPDYDFVKFMELEG